MAKWEDIKRADATRTAKKMRGGGRGRDQSGRRGPRPPPGAARGRGGRRDAACVSGRARLRRCFVPRAISLSVLPRKEAAVAGRAAADGGCEVGWDVDPGGSARELFRNQPEPGGLEMGSGGAGRGPETCTQITGANVL